MNSRTKKKTRNKSRRYNFWADLFSYFTDSEKSNETGKSSQETWYSNLSTSERRAIDDVVRYDSKVELANPYNIFGQPKDKQLVEKLDNLIQLNKPINREYIKKALLLYNKLQVWAFLVNLDYNERKYGGKEWSGTYPVLNAMITPFPDSDEAKVAREIYKKYKPLVSESQKSMELPIQKTQPKTQTQYVQKRAETPQRAKPQTQPKPQTQSTPSTQPVHEKRIFPKFVLPYTKLIREIIKEVEELKEDEDEFF